MTGFAGDRETNEGEKMKKIAFGLFLLTLSAPAFAGWTNFTCAGLQAAVASQGWVGDGTGVFIVSSGRFCSGSETTRPAYVQTSDDNACLAGWVCVDRPGGE